MHVATLDNDYDSTIAILDLLSLLSRLPTFNILWYPAIFSHTNLILHACTGKSVTLLSARSRCK